MNTTPRFKKNIIPMVQAVETQSKGSIHPTTTRFYSFPKSKSFNLLKAETNLHAKMCEKFYDNVFWLPKF